MKGIMEPLKDKNGTVVKVGDKVRTPAGDVVRIQGSLPKRRSFRMADCEITLASVDEDEGPAADEQIMFG